MKILYILFFCFPFCLFGQEFKKFEDMTQNTTVIRYYNTDAQVIIQKTIYHHKDSVKFEIGLLLYRTSVKSDDFMFENAAVVFDNNKILIFSDRIVSQFVASGKSLYAVKHILSEKEMELFKSNKINSFKIYQYENKLDKWQKEEVLKTFLKIGSE